MSKIIQVEHLKYHYPDNQNPALDDISFEINDGDWIGIVGHNGSGKSTLTRAIDGLLDLDSGEIIIDGVSLTDESVWDIRAKIGIVFQNPDNQFVGATVADDVAFGLENRKVPRAEMVPRVKRALAMLDMTDFASREPASLSGGQKQRVALAGVVALQPKILILDEATSMLDPEGRQTILEVLRKLRAETDLTILSITHDVNEAALADKLMVINDGKLVTEAPPKEVFMEHDHLHEWGLEVPFGEQLKQALNDNQISTPKEFMDVDRMVEWTWQKLNLKM